MRRLSLALATFLLLTAARHRAVSHPATPPLSQPPVDVFSYAEPLRVTTRHLALDLEVDFNQRRVRGSAALTIENLTGTDRLVLDTDRLTISSVRRDGEAAPFTLGSRTARGAPLTISITPTTRVVTIEYISDPVAPGLNWNTAAQSFGRVTPYLYSLNQPIGARSWIPVQDTPAVRMTYEATVRVPAGMLALMSAENPTATNASGVYTFRMPETVPAYLVALAAGRLEFHAFDERTGVYAEPELMADARRELAYLPEMLDAAEEIAGPHPFPRHDILLMPPTFIVGGMEHPRLNFVNPSVVPQNRDVAVLPSLLVAHELAHSWAGDATTLATWDDVWLNEGITSYLAVRILEKLIGPDRAEHELFGDRSELEAFVAVASNADQSRMHRNFQATDSPFGNFGIAAYTKGELFLQTLETRIGRETFDALLRDYFATFAFRWVDDRNFLAFLREHIDDYSLGLHLAEWIYSPGIPANITAPASSAIYRRVLTDAGRFANGTPFASIDSSGWTAVEIDLFLQLVPDAVQFPRMAEIDAALHLSARETAPLRWLIDSINAHYAAANPAIDRVLLRGGTNNSVITLYDTLIDAGQRPRAQSLFAAARARYHTQVVQIVEFLLSA